MSNVDVIYQDLEVIQTLVKFITLLELVLDKHPTWAQEIGEMIADNREVIELFRKRLGDAPIS